MQRGSVGGRDLPTAFGNRQLRPSTSGAPPQPQAGGYTTPTARQLAGVGASGGVGGVRRCFLPRPSGGGASGGKRAPEVGNSGGASRAQRRRSSTDNGGARNNRLLLASRGSVAGCSRPSVSGASGAKRLSTAGPSTTRVSVVGAAATSGLARLSVMPSSEAVNNRMTPLRNTATSNYLMPPMSAQSRRLSAESRQSSVAGGGKGRRKMQEVRPISDAAFKKTAVDNILHFLTDHGYCDSQTTMLSRRTLTHPTTKDFTNIFTFIYSKLFVNYVLPTHYEVEIPKLLKLMNYPTQISKSTFITIGSPHSWPTLLAMLSWLCDLIADVTSANLCDMAFPPDFSADGGEANQAWDEFNMVLDIHDVPDSKDAYLERYNAELLRSVGGVEEAEEELRQCREQYQQTLDEEDPVPQLRQSLIEMRSDMEKLRVYNSDMLQKHQQLENDLHHQQQQQDALLLEQQQLTNEVARLSALRESQHLTAEELLTIKNHAVTSAATSKSLLAQGKHTQERIWEVEVLQCRAQLSLSEHIQSYNTLCQSLPVHFHIRQGTAHIATTATATDAVMEDGYKEGVEEDEEEGCGGTSSGQVLAPLQLCDLEELQQKLTEERRMSRAAVIEGHAARSKAKELLWKWEEKVEGKQHQLSQMHMRCRNLEEDITCTKQENDTQEGTLLAELSRVREALASVPRPDMTRINRMRTHLQTLAQQEQKHQHEMKRATFDGTRRLVGMTLKVDEQLKWEAERAIVFRAAFARILSKRHTPAGSQKASEIPRHQDNKLVVQSKQTVLTASIDTLLIRQTEASLLQCELQKQDNSKKARHTINKIKIADGKENVA